MAAAAAASEISMDATVAPTGSLQQTKLTLANVIGPLEYHRQVVRQITS